MMAKIDECLQLYNWIYTMNTIWREECDGVRRRGRMAMRSIYQKCITQIGCIY